MRVEVGRKDGVVTASAWEGDRELSRKSGSDEAIVVRNTVVDALRRLASLIELGRYKPEELFHFYTETPR